MNETEKVLLRGKKILLRPSFVCSFKPVRDDNPEEPKFEILGEF